MGYGAFQFISQDEDTWLPRWIASSSTNKEEWERINASNLVKTAVAAEDAQTQQEAKRPYIVRYKGRGSFEAGSPNLLALGQQSDMSELVIRSDYEIRNLRRREPQEKGKDGEQGSGEQEQ